MRARIASVATFIAFGSLSAQEVDLRGMGRDRGDPNAPVVVVEFADFGCPSCAEFATGSWTTIEREYVDTGKVLWKLMPFAAGAFPNGREAARAAECAAEQGAFWPMHDVLFAGQRAWGRLRDPGPEFASYAEALGLQKAAFETCYREDGGGDRTERNNDAARALRVRGTPTFFVDGRRVEGAPPVDAFRSVLDGALGAG